VTADEAGKVSGPCLDDGQRGDRVDRLGRPHLAGQRPSAAHDLDGLGGVREGQPGRRGGDFQGAPFSAAVAFLAAWGYPRPMLNVQLAVLAGPDAQMALRVAA
jgi:hypothetical protein